MVKNFMIVGYYGTLKEFYDAHPEVCSIMRI